LYEGLNTGLGSDDDVDHVRTNRALATRHLGVDHDRLVTVYQVHSPDAIIVDAPLSGDRPKADGLVTKTPGLVIGVQTADCGPVLFADEKAGVIGAAHAGWKGATGGVLESTLDAMEKLGASRTSIIAILGPTISAGNYEVGPEFIDRLRSLDEANQRWFGPSKNDGHAMFDLPGYIVDRLEKQGVASGWTGQCTYADEAGFYSYRRTTHRKETDYGRQLSALCLKA
jgi:YfiH family protein